MANKTIIYFDGFSEEGFYVFRTPREFPLVIEGCNKGIVTLHIPNGTSIRYLSDIVGGCFNEKSNFVKEVSNFFNIKKLNQINFVFNGIEMTVTKENADKTFYIWQDLFKAKKNKEKISQKV